MEFLLGLAMTAVLFLIMGFNFSHIGMLVLFLTACAVALTGLFFLGCIALLAFSKTKYGTLSRFDDEARFRAVYYSVDGEERRGIFPYEKALKKKLYAPDRKVRLRCCPIFNVVVDKGAMMTIILGSSVFIPGGVFAVIGVVDFIKGVEFAPM